MKQWKRLAAVLLCLCMALSLAACGGDGGGGKEPVPLSKFVSKGTHLIYYTSPVAKNGGPTKVLLFEDGKFTYLPHGPRRDGEALTYGDMCGMTDKEIAELVHADKDACEDEPYTLCLFTDSTGNAPDYERLYYRAKGSSNTWSVELQADRPATTSVVLEDEYFYTGSSVLGYCTRGAGFTFDPVDSKDVIVDPNSEEQIAIRDSVR